MSWADGFSRPVGCQVLLHPMGGINLGEEGWTGYSIVVSRRPHLFLSQLRSWPQMVDHCLLDRWSCPAGLEIGLSCVDIHRTMYVCACVCIFVCVLYVCISVSVCVYMSGDGMRHGRSPFWAINACVGVQRQTVDRGQRTDGVTQLLRLRMMCPPAPRGVLCDQVMTLGSPHVRRVRHTCLVPEREWKWAVGPLESCPPIQCPWKNVQS